MKKTQAEKLFDKCVTMLTKDLAHLNTKVEEGKLSYDQARDLVSYMKLLKDVKAMEMERRAVKAKAKAEKKATLTDEQLEALALSASQANPAPSNPDKT